MALTIKDIQILFNDLRVGYGGSYKLVSKLYAKYEVFTDSRYQLPNGAANDDIIAEYISNVFIPHKQAVYDAGHRLANDNNLYKYLHSLNDGFDYGSFINNLLAHDLSKLSHNEIYGYCDVMLGKKSELSKLAWHHHKHNNPHHPEYWFDVNKDGSVACMDMPSIYIAEMVADWIGAGVSYGDTIHDWLPKNINKFSFTDKTKSILRNILDISNVIDISSLPGW